MHAVRHYALALGHGDIVEELTFAVLIVRSRCHNERSSDCMLAGPSGRKSKGEVA